MYFTAIDYRFVRHKQCIYPVRCRSVITNGKILKEKETKKTFSTTPSKPLNEIQRNLTGSKISTSSTKFVICGRSEKQDGRPGL